MITEKNASRHELIGLEATVTSGPDPSIVGAGGTVVDETRNTLVMERRGSGRRIRVAKEGSRFRLALPGGRFTEIDGSSMAFRPEDRVKRCR